MSEKTFLKVGKGENQGVKIKYLLIIAI